MAEIRLRIFGVHFHTQSRRTDKHDNKQFRDLFNFEYGMRPCEHMPYMRLACCDYHYGSCVNSNASPYYEWMTIEEFFGWIRKDLNVFVLVFFFFEWYKSMSDDRIPFRRKKNYFISPLFAASLCTEMGKFDTRTVGTCHIVWIGIYMHSG